MPNVPTGTYRQKDVAKFIVRLDSAHSDCKTKLEAVVALIEKQNANALALKGKIK